MEFITIEAFSEERFTERKSLFIGRALPVSSEEEAREFIDEIKEKHKDATHNVYAFSIENRITRMSDDGEPSGTAGRPVLEAILQKKLTNVCVVVTRYFGGILLGAGGLIRAYRKAAELCLNNASIIIVKKIPVYRVTVCYEHWSRVLKLAATLGLPQKEPQYLQEVTGYFGVIPELEEKFLREVIDLSSGQAKIQKEDEMLVKYKEGKYLPV
ncbi:IMPACT family protein [Carboxydothermus pertinax]|uniref:YigZ family protein n=1 Tax=Carboxydothermus pertinax TaxID=870242 RepID=A0A1L8CSS7_9THEO|nr:YigZ family protein [Carboxydothermus pertinax]GAV21978.1 YigZ family protein [Carboxydothermus pertinax]